MLIVEFYSVQSPIDCFASPTGIWVAASSPA